VLRLLFLDDNRQRHEAFKRRATKLLGNRRHQLLQVSDPMTAVQLIERLGPKLSAVYLDRDLSQDLTGEYVSAALARLPVERRPPKVIVHSRNFFRAPFMVRQLRKAGYSVLRHPFEL
jgi:hypothetical protein